MTNVSTQYWGNTTQIFFANPQDKSTDDVTYSGGRTVVFDAKFTEKDRITYQALSDFQRETLLNYQNLFL